MGREQQERDHRSGPPLDRVGEVGLDPPSETIPDDDLLHEDDYDDEDDDVTMLSNNNDADAPQQNKVIKVHRKVKEVMKKVIRILEKQDYEEKAFILSEAFRLQYEQNKWFIKRQTDWIDNRRRRVDFMGIIVPGPGVVFQKKYAEYRSHIHSITKCVNDMIFELEKNLEVPLLRMTKKNTKDVYRYDSNRGLKSLGVWKDIKTTKVVIGPEIVKVANKGIDGIKEYMAMIREQYPKRRNPLTMKRKGVAGSFSRNPIRDLDNMYGKRMKFVPRYLRHQKRSLEHRITVYDMIKVGAITPGTNVIEVKYKTNSIKANLLPDGKIEVVVANGRQFRYTSLSTFALSFKRMFNPKLRTDDGWKSAMYKGKTMVKIREELHQKIVQGEVKLDDDDDDDEDDDDDDKDDEEDDDEQNNSSNIQYGTTAALPRTNRNVIRLKRTRTNSNSNSNSIPQQQMPNHNTQNLQSLQQNLLRQQKVQQYQLMRQQQIRQQQMQIRVNQNLRLQQQLANARNAQISIYNNSSNNSSNNSNNMNTNPYLYHNNNIASSNNLNPMQAFSQQLSTQNTLVRANGNFILSNNSNKNINGSSITNAIVIDDDADDESNDSEAPGGVSNNPYISFNNKRRKKTHF